MARTRTCNLCAYRKPGQNWCTVRASIMLAAAPACEAFRNRNTREYMRRYMAERRAARGLEKASAAGLKEERFRNSRNSGN